MGDGEDESRGVPAWRAGAAESCGLRELQPAVARACDVLIAVFCRPRAFRAQVIAPLLVPHVEYDIEVAIVCLDPEAQYSDDIRIVMVNGDSAVPILSALIRIPLSDIVDM